MDARDVRGGKRIRVQGAQAVFRQAILRVKTRRSRARLLAASPVSRRCLALGKSAGCKCGGYRGRKLTAPHAKGCGGKATHRPPDVHLRPRAGTFRRNPSQTERTVTPKSDATRTAHSPSPDYISPSHPRLCHIINYLTIAYRHLAQGTTESRTQRIVLGGSSATYSPSDTPSARPEAQSRAFSSPPAPKDANGTRTS